MIMNRKGMGAGTIKYAIIALVFLTVFLSMLPNLIHTAATGVTSLATEYGNTTLYGTSASAIGVQIDDWTGYFWVLGPLIMLIVIILKVFKARG